MKPNMGKHYYLTQAYFADQIALKENASTE
jgi:hypothetical protein